MTGKKETKNPWHHTSVVLRADIYAQAHQQGIDISTVCNTALADLLGMDYHQQQLDSIPVTRPVIIAKNGLPSDEPAPGAHPAGAVINADDPAAIVTVRSIPQAPKKIPAPMETDPVHTETRKKEAPVLTGTPGTAPAGKTKKPAAAKTLKDNGLKKFISTGITRSDAEDAFVSKDDMYSAFTRFCHDHTFTPVMDRKAFTLALKNKFAFFDKTINGTPGWVKVRLK